MRAKFGIVFMSLGLCMLLGAFSLILYNRHEANSAEQSAMELLPQLIQQIQIESLPTEGEENTSSDASSSESEVYEDIDLPAIYLEPTDFVMEELEIEDHAYIGYLSIPKLNLDLPVMADWSYPSLKIAPCRYFGTVKGEDLVIMAHNYERHFGKISELYEGDSVLFVDVKGHVTAYKVVARDILASTAIEEMTAGDFDLALFTCTYSGNERVTVFCDKAK